MRSFCKTLVAEGLPELELESPMRHRVEWELPSEPDRPSPLHLETLPLAKDKVLLSVNKIT